MKGFNLVMQLNSLNKNEFNIEVNKEVYKNNNINITKTTNNKFEKDKLFFKYKNNFFLLEGVITNSSELNKKYNKEKWEETFICMYENNNNTFFDEFRGVFCGFIYNIEDNSIHLFVDHLRKKDIFYMIKDNKLYCTTYLPWVASIDKTSNELDEDAAYLLLTFGGTLEKRTLIKNIRKILYGSYLKIDNKGDLLEQQYYKIKLDHPVEESNEDYYIENIDKLFKQAIDRQFSKNEEYGYKHLVSLSAGRDSRMTTYVSKELGYEQNVLNYTFSESNQLDEIIPKAISKELKNEWIFKSLDNGNCMLKLEELNKDICGESIIGEFLHLAFFLKDLNFLEYGIIHSGQLGGVMLSCYGKEFKEPDLKKNSYIYSKKLIDRIKDIEIIASDTKSEEEFNYINRGIGVTLKSSTLTFKYTETVSPFLDIDFVDFCFKIPYKTRAGKGLYDNWLLKKYPEAAKYPHNGRIIGSKEYMFFGKKSTLQDLPKKIVAYIRRKIVPNYIEKNNMNPKDFWYSSNKDLRDFINNYYEENIVELEKIKNPELKSDIMTLFNEGNCIEKTQSLTIMSTLKLFF